MDSKGELMSAAVAAQGFDAVTREAPRIAEWFRGEGFSVEESYQIAMTLLAFGQEAGWRRCLEILESR